MFLQSTIYNRQHEITDTVCISVTFFGLCTDVFLAERLGPDVLWQNNHRGGKEAVRSPHACHTQAAQCWVSQSQRLTKHSIGWNRRISSCQWHCRWFFQKVIGILLFSYTITVTCTLLHDLVWVAECQHSADSVWARKRSLGDNKTTFAQEEMHHHLVQCFQSKKLMPFPGGEQGAQV